MQCMPAADGVCQLWRWSLLVLQTFSVERSYSRWPRVSVVSYMV